MRTKESLPANTDEWELYEQALNTLRRQEMFVKHERHKNFYFSKQWEGMDLGDMSPIVYNIIRPIISHKVSVVASSGYRIFYGPMAPLEGRIKVQVDEMCDNLSKHALVVWEREKMDHKMRRILMDAAIDGEGILYFDYAGEEIHAEIIEKTSIFYALETESDLERQPYILITFRRSVEEIRRQAKENKIPEEEIMRIVGDAYTIGDMRVSEKENCPMCLCILKMYKKDGQVYIKKSTRTCVYEKERPVGLKRYPVAHFLWREVMNSSRGMGEVEGLVANQIEINKTAMRRSVAVRMGAYPKLVVAKNQVSNEKALSEVGSTIFVASSPLESVKSAVDYLSPASMSPDSQALQNELITISRELSGSGELATGAINPEHASGKAILAVKQQSEAPIGEQIEALKDFIENIALIFYDMWRVFGQDQKLLYAKNENNKGVHITGRISRRLMEKTAPSVAIDVSPASPFDRFAREQGLENLLMSGHITFEEYVSALPFDSVMPKDALQIILKRREEEQKKIVAIQAQAEALNAKMQMDLDRAQELAEKQNRLESSGQNKKASPQQSAQKKAQDAKSAGEAENAAQAAITHEDDGAKG